MEQQAITRPNSFEEFWPDYLKEHSDPRTRALHLGGTVLGLGCAALYLTTRKPRWAIAGLVSAYGAAWASHALYEKNTPATFSHPLWSARGDLRMLRLAFEGRLDKEAAALSSPLIFGSRASE